MFERLNALKVTIHDFNDVKTTVERSKDIEDIGELFKFLFSRFSYKAFTTESAEAYEDLKNVLQRLGGKQQVSAKDLHDLYNFYARLYKFDIIDAVKNDFPEYVHFFEKAEKITPLELKNELIQDGADFIKNNFDKIFDDIKTINEDKIFVSQLQELLKDDKFYEAKRYIKNRISEEIEKEFPGEGNYTKHFIDYYDLNPEHWGERKRNLLKRYLELRHKISFECKDKFKEYNELANEVETRGARAKRLKTEIYAKVAISLMAGSGISKEQAEIWATNNVYITKGIEQKLKKIGYPKEQLLKDIADFYRYSGGKLGPVEFIMTRKERAFAYSNKMQIAVTKYFNRRTLFHECGHLAEELDDLSMKCSHQFRDDRATGKLQSLRSITGNKGYSSSEMAYPDNFINPYVGKVYQWPASEVYSMAIENMATPERIIEFIEKDPEHFNLFLGVCLHKNPELSKRIQKIADTAAKNYKNNLDKEKNENIWQNEIVKAIKSIEIPFEKLLTSQSRYEDFKLRVRGSKGDLLYKIDDRTDTYIYSGTKKNAIAAAYFAILSKRNQIPLEFNPGQYQFKNNITEYVNGTNPPSWYNSDTGLPTLDLGDKGTTIANLYNTWMSELKRKTPPELLDLLKRENGFCDYSIDYLPEKANKKIWLNFIERGDDFPDYKKWLIRDRVSNIAYIAYLMILNDKGLIQIKESYKSLIANELQYCLAKKTVPDWFNPEQGLPELEI